MANITAAEHPKLVLEMTAMERTTPAHYDEWNVRHQQLLDNDKYLNEQFINVFSDSAAAHNSIYRGKNLTNVYTVDEICQRISAGTFKDLYVGDYFDIRITTDLGGAETVRCILAGFDVFWNNGDTAFTKHHAVIVPKDCFKTKSVMNDTNVTTGGYVGSKMYKTVLPVYAAALQTALNNHILSHRELLTTAVSTTGNSNAGAGITGYASNWEWKDCLVKLMSEIQVYGSTVLSSSFYDTGCDNIQFPLFRLAPNLKVAGLGHNGSRWWYWLSAVVSAAAFANCNNNGNSNNNNAAGDGGVRPISCMYTKCRLCADIRYRKGKLVLPKGKEAHLLIEGGWGNILMHPDTSVGARNEVKLYE